MKQTLIAAIFLLIFISCNDHKNAGTGSSMDSAASHLTPDSSAVSKDSTASHATGTTGTGTVSDSGNAAHPGSDTSHK